MGRTIHVGLPGGSYAAVDITDEAADKLITSGLLCECGDPEDHPGHDLHIDPLWLGFGGLEALLLGIFGASQPHDGHKGLPVAGYAPTQSQTNIDLVNEGKILEERVLRWLDRVQYDAFGFRVGAAADIQKGFMQAYRSVFQPNSSRISLPEDGE